MSSNKSVAGSQMTIPDPFPRLRWWGEWFPGLFVESPYKQQPEAFSIAICVWQRPFKMRDLSSFAFLQLQMHLHGMESFACRKLATGVELFFWIFRHTWLSLGPPAEVSGSQGFHISGRESNTTCSWTAFRSTLGAQVALRDKVHFLTG